MTSNLMSPRLEINSGVEADKAACSFTASIASAYWLSTSRITVKIKQGSTWSWSTGKV
jgi:hypothetical protein